MKKFLLTLAIAALAPLAKAQTWQIQDDEDDILSTERTISVMPRGETADGPLRVRRRIGTLESAALPHTGAPKVPVVLVQFPDRPFQISGATADEVRNSFECFFNTESHQATQQATDNYGSVRSYFIEQSNGAFSPEFTILGPVTTTFNYAEYGKNSGTNNNSGVTLMYKDALSKLAKEDDIDWTVFDNNGDGQVDMVFYIYAGWGENTVKAYDPDAIWPHEYPYATAVTLNSGQIIRFACMAASSEARYKSKAQLEADVKDPQFAPTGYNVANLRMDGVGTSIHELSHALGLPDMYDTRTSGETNFGMDAWSIMDYGCYNYGGRYPCMYTAYERDFMEWQPMEELTEPCVVTIQPFSKGGCGYKVVNDANPAEYYVLENRQPLDWDTYGCTQNARGLQVTHVDYDRSAWTGNKVNSTANHPRMQIIAANNRYVGASTATSSAEYKETLIGNLFPFAASYQDLTDITTPAATTYTGDFMHKPIRNITQNEDGSISLCFCTNGQLAAPIVEDASAITETSFTANWQTVENATAYVVELYRDEYLERTDTLTDTRMEYTDLTPQTAMKYRVMALADAPEDYVPSEWSKFSYLETLIDALHNIPVNEQTVRIYTLGGSFVTECHADEIARMRPITGVYILRYEDGQARKLMVK